VSWRGRALGDLLFHRQEGGKALWRFLLKKRDPAATVYVFADQGGTDRRALSLALAVCDTMGLPRGEALFNADFHGVHPVTPRAGGCGVPAAARVLL
jgi:hypothetical protein